MKRCNPKELIIDLFDNKYKGADCILWGGSVQKGSYNETSDLDLVIIFSKVEKAYRESFIYKDWPVDCFINDPETLNYFFSELDGPSGYPVLMGLVNEGEPLPKQTMLSNLCKRLASKVLQAGPPALSKDTINFRRYYISDLADDLGSSTRPDESIAIATELYHQLADFYLRANGKWSAKGKWLARRLTSENEEVSKDIHQAFNQLFTNDKKDEIFKVVDKVLSPFGGKLWDGYYLPGQPHWKKPIDE